MAEIKLTQGKVAIVDDADFEWLNQWKWNYCQGYAYRMLPRDGNTRKRIAMHRSIVKAPLGIEVDHRNMNKLDNRRDNLRLSTRSQNQANTGPYRNNKSGYKGVSRANSASKPWRATIKHHGKYKFIGNFDTVEEAALAYDAAAKELHQDFARLNYV